MHISLAHANDDDDANDTNTDINTIDSKDLVECKICDKSQDTHVVCGSDGITYPGQNYIFCKQKCGESKCE